MGTGPEMAVVWFVFAACTSEHHADSGSAPLVVDDGDGDGWSVPDDCDDRDPTVSPDALEACNGVDDDCSGEIDEGLALELWPDEDADGWGRDGPGEVRCDAAGFVAESGDCDDDDPEIHPYAQETCGDDVDDDCDGAVDADDEDAIGRVVNYPDADSDGYGVGGGTPTCDGTQPPGTARAAGDCDDLDANVSPGASELCAQGGEASVDEDCDGLFDADDPNVADAFETWPDEDGDGFGVGGRETEVGCEPAPGWAANDFDCDDGDRSTSPAADEICSDGNDNDCDGDLDVCGPIGDVDASGAAGRIVGVGEYELAGIAVADAGDIDGDGAHEMVMGSWLGSSTSGTASLFLGAVSGAITTKSADLTIDSPSSGDSLGWAVAGAGDYDADHYGDLLVGAYGLGRAFLFFGPVTGDYEAPDADVVLGAADASGEAGYSLAGLGDLDGDACDDVLVGAPLAEDAGRVYVAFGPTDGDVHLDDATVRMTGESRSAFGASLDASTDFDGDGLRDLAVGAPEQTTSRVGAGAAFLFAGSDLTAGLYAVDAAAVLLGATRDGALGTSVGAADLDGDGYADLVAGAPGLRPDDAMDVVGGALVVRGPPTGSVDAVDADVLLLGADEGGEAGFSIAAGGDADRDGYDDLAVGAPSMGAGAVYLLLGPIADGSDDLAALAHARVVGEATGASAGRATAWLQDPEADGMDDLLVGAPFHSEPKATYAGAAYRFDGWEW